VWGVEEKHGGAGRSGPQSIQISFVFLFIIGPQTSFSNGPKASSDKQRVLASFQ